MSSGISSFDRFFKRAFDLIFSICLLFLFFPVILACFVISSIDTRSWGFFFQERIGLNGVPFKIVKIKTLVDCQIQTTSSVSALETCRMTKIGSFFRKYKLDELPQLFNVLVGDMSFVGPRPDVAGYADILTGDDRLFLTVRPGITGPASIKYSREEYILSSISNPQKYNDEIIWPDKVRLNIEYIESYSFRKDLFYLLQTIWK